MTKIVEVDTKAFLQGVFSASRDSNISRDFADRINSAVQDISYLNSVGRLVCDYSLLLVTLSKILPVNWIQLDHLWGYIGESLVNGISVAQN